jgi:hypothetical protein
MSDTRQLIEQWEVDFELARWEVVQQQQEERDAQARRAFFRGLFWGLLIVGPFWAGLIWWWYR